MGGPGALPTVPQPGAVARHTPLAKLVPGRRLQLPGTTVSGAALKALSVRAVPLVLQHEECSQAPSSRFYSLHPQTLSSTESFQQELHVCDVRIFFSLAHALSLHVLEEHRAPKAVVLNGRHVHSSVVSF